MQTLEAVSSPNLLERLVHETGLDQVVPPDTLYRGLREIRDEMHQLALDAHKADARGVSFSDAVTDWFAFPHLARFHVLMEDVLRQPLPMPLVAWYRALLGSPEPPTFAEARTALVELAANDPSEIRRSLWRFLLVEGVHLNLLLMRHWNLHEAAMAQMHLSDLHYQAEVTVTRWFDTGPAIEEGVRPFEVIACAALKSMESAYNDLRNAVRVVQDHVATELERRRLIEMTLRELSDTDYVLVRNDIAAVLGEQPLSLVELQRRHGDVLGTFSRAALEQRVSRARRRFTRALRATAADEQPAATTSRRHASRPSLFNLLDEHALRTKG